MSKSESTATIVDYDRQITPSEMLTALQSPGAIITLSQVQAVYRAAGRDSMSMIDYAAFLAASHTTR